MTNEKVLNSSRKNNPILAIRRAIPLVVLWEIWLERNRIRYEDAHSSTDRVTRNVYQWLKDLTQFSKPKSELTYSEKLILEAVGIPIVKPKTLLYMAVRWSRPPPGRFK